MTTAYMAAKTLGLDEFTRVYDPEQDDSTELLFAALTNNDPASRVAIANRLLDDGADAAQIHANESTINFLLAQVHHDVQLEAPLLRRLVEGGADVNHRERRGDLPILQLVDINAPGGEEELRPMYAALFDAPALDLSLPANPRKPEASQRSHFEFPAWQRFPVLLEHVRRWDQRSSA